MINDPNNFTNPVLSASREDGYADAWGNVFQGVRVYDPTMAQWTAPDAYAGDVHDPMSQKPFMWNNNNPLDFEDPSGYEGCVAGTCGLPFDWKPDMASGAAFGLAAYNFLIGDDVKTLSNPNAGGGAKALAVIGLVSWVLPEVKGGIKAVEYLPKVLGKATDLFHAFPASFDEEILSHGKLTIDLKNGYHQWTETGSVNGKAGHYELGGTVGKDGTLTVTHRTFIPDKKAP